MSLVLPALTDCRWWFESLLVHSGVSSATRRKATGANQKKRRTGGGSSVNSLGTLNYIKDLSFNSGLPVLQCTKCRWETKTEFRCLGEGTALAFLAPTSQATTQFADRRAGIFFSSSLADVALWLGPYMSISGKTSLCTRTKTVWKCRQITTTTTTHNPARRPANPPARLAFRQEKQQTRQTKGAGRSPNKNNHQKDLPKDTVV